MLRTAKCSSNWVKRELIPHVLCNIWYHFLSWALLENQWQSQVVHTSQHRAVRIEEQAVVMAAQKFGVWSFFLRGSFGHVWLWEEVGSNGEHFDLIAVCHRNFSAGSVTSGSDHHTLKILPFKLPLNQK